MRVYLPATLPLLRGLVLSGAISAPVAYAVTPALREWYVEGDAEALEYAALAVAARASLRLLAAAPEDAARRIVVLAEVPDALVRPAPDLDRAAVRLGEPVRTAQVVSAHVDDAAAEGDVRAAALVSAEADAGDEDAGFLVDGVEDHELGWYAVQELDALVELEHP